MVEKLKEAMPSDDLAKLVGDMQEMTNQKFKLNEQYQSLETELLENENELRQLAKNDTGLSQKVINLRKQIKESRNELKQL